MEPAAWAFSVLGALLSVVAAVWLVAGFNPYSPKYSEIEGGGYSQSDPIGLRRLLQDQDRVAGVAAFGATFQFVGVVLAVLAQS